MRKNRSLVTAAVLLAMAALGCQDKINFLRARSQLNDGVKAFEAANFPAAAEYFERAVELDPELMAARTYRATALMMQYIPGGESEENLRVANEALQGFEEVLKHDPDNELALSSMASLYFNMKEFEKAREANKQIVERYPNNKEAFYTIGVIDWTQTYQPRLEARAELGMKQEDPGPIPDDEVREELAQKHLPLIEEGLQHLQKAVEIDPQYNEAMAYINLLYREQADLSESKEEYEKYLAMADDWAQKSLETMKMKAEAGTQEAF